MTDQSKQLLAAHMEKTRLGLDRFLSTHGVSSRVLARAMEDFTHTVFDLPQGVVCRPGCAHCCHLRVGVSIPELLVIFQELDARADPGWLKGMESRVMETAACGNTLGDGFWLESGTPCPFLDDSCHCMIYPFRPFSCRAYHSTDEKICRQGFDKRRKIQVPCFPLYRSATDMYSAVFIRVLKDKGFSSFQVGLVKGLALLFEDRTRIRRWLDKEAVFQEAKL